MLKNAKKITLDPRIYFVFAWPVIFVNNTQCSHVLHLKYEYSGFNYNDNFVVINVADHIGIVAIGAIAKCFNLDLGNSSSLSNVFGRAPLAMSIRCIKITAPVIESKIVVAF